MLCIFALNYKAMITNDTLRFKIDIRDYEYGGYLNSFSFVDVVASNGWNTILGGTERTKIKGLVRATNPAGTIYYGGTAYQSFDFTTSDTVGSTATWGITDKEMPNVLSLGNYQFDYRVRYQITDGITGCNSGVFTTADTTLLTDLGATPSGLYLQVFGSVTSHNGTYLITGLNINPNNPNVCNIIVANPPTDFTAAESMGIVFTATKTYNYNITKNAPALSATHDCRYSQMTIDNDTDYSIVNASGTTIQPTSTTETGIVDYPITIKPQVTSTTFPFTIGFATSYNSGAYLYTDTYLVGLDAYTEYNLENWTNYDSSTYAWVTLISRISSSITHDVECDSCLCNCYSCLLNLNIRLEDSIANRDGKKAGYLELVNRLTWNLQLYNLGGICGEELSSICATIKELLKSETCCSETQSSGPVPIVPTSVNVITGSGSVPIIFRTGTQGQPANPIEGQVTIFTESGSTFIIGDYYQYTGGVWVYRINMIPTPATIKNPLLLNNTTSLGASGGDGIVQLISYSLASGAITTDEKIKISALYDITTGYEGTIYLTANAVTLLSASVVASAQTTILLEVELTYLAATTGFAKTKITYLGLPDSTVSSYVALVSGLLWTSAQDIKAYRNGTAVGYSNGCLLKNFEIERKIF
jgi:hypothetical protein